MFLKIIFFENNERKNCAGIRYTTLQVCAQSGLFLSLFFVTDLLQNLRGTSPDWALGGSVEEAEVAAQDQSIWKLLTSQEAGAEMHSTY